MSLLSPSLLVGRRHLEPFLADVACDASFALSPALARWQNPRKYHQSLQNNVGTSRASSRVCSRSRLLPSSSPPPPPLAIMSVSGPLGSLPIPNFIHKRLFSQSSSNRSLNINNINPHVKEAKYAVRGELAIKSEQYRAQLAKGEGKDLPFDSVISANIGNPQQLDQKPITFFRQVASLVENPQLLENEETLTNGLGYNSDVVERAKKLLKDVKSVGAYSQSQGAPGIRQSVAEFIERRDGYPADPQSIYLCGGASAGVNALMSVICASPQTGILVPIPQYPLYTATLSLLNAQMVPYYLKEESQWSTDVGDMRTALKEAQKKGIDVRAVVVINPGNPTGGSLSAEHISSVLELAAEEKLVVLADEVYQTNVFEGKFHSFKKSLRELQEKNQDGKFDHVELASLHSISKGMVGECGHRGGYYEMVGFDPEVRHIQPTSQNITKVYAGCVSDLQVRQHHALPTGRWTMLRGDDGESSSRGRSIILSLPRRIRYNLPESEVARLCVVRRIQGDGRRRVPVTPRQHVPLPDHQAATKSDRRCDEGGQEPR